MEETIKKILPLDQNAISLAAARQDSLTKPAGSLGRLEELSIRIAGIQAKARPQIKQKTVIVMAADHGITAEGISAYPREVTAQMAANFAQGGAAITVIARQIGAKVVVVDIGVASPTASFRGILQHKIAPGTRNMCQGPAMTQDEARQSIETGIKVVQSEVDKGLDIIGTGEMGIGNTTASSAISAVMSGKSVPEVTGRGTGLR
jgi:nicotinate-nucleotide--dimethylbenzimidazole phosphoribosyltransferase